MDPDALRACPPSEALSWTAEPPPEAPHLVAGRCLLALRTLARLGAHLALRNGQLLLRMQEGRVHRTWGFAAFPDFARERLQLSPRTARRQLSLARTLSQSPLLDQAFLDGRLSVCQVLTLRRVREAASLPFWIDLAGSMTVRELETRVREAVPAATTVPAGAQATASHRVVFSAPRPAALVWDQGLDAARRVLGWNAPVARCLEAILAESEGETDHGTQGLTDETAPDGEPASPIATSAPAPHPYEPAPSHPGAAPRQLLERRGPAQPAGSERSRSPSRRLPAPVLSDPAVRAIRQTLARVEAEMESIRARVGEGGLLPSAGPGENRPAAGRLLQEFAALRGTARQIRLLEGRLLHLLWAHHLHRALGCPSLAEFAETHLGLSERAARDRIRQAFLFEDEPHLTRAYRRGEIGLTQARLLSRVILRSTVKDHLTRARQVTLRQLEREVRFLTRLAEFAPELWRRHPGPLPSPGLEQSLRQALERKGVEERRPGTPGDSPSDLREDPAANPLLMTRLETLLDRLILHAYPDDRQRLAGPETRTTLEFLAPPWLGEMWNRALDRIRAERGPLPTWACAVLLIRNALDVWLEHDPATRPTEHAVLERDGYACRAPGCASRGNLEVHHIRFRSRGGTDHPGNKVTLCHVHHHHVLHAGWLRLSGTAPENLRWEMGGNCGPQPVLRLWGDRLIPAFSPFTFPTTQLVDPELLP